VTELFEVLLQGILLGGLYSLFASGLAVAFGVMRLVNLSHGDFIVLSAFAGLGIVSALPINPFGSLLLLVPVMATIGYIMQTSLFNRLAGADPLRPLLVTFGLSIIIQNCLLLLFSADTRRIKLGMIEVQSIDVAGQSVGVFPAIVLTTALAVTVALQLVFFHTRLGAKLRATSDSPNIVRLMGIDPDRVYAIASALGFAAIAIAGFLMAVRTNFDPFVGPARLLIAFEAVIIGGLGSFWGAFVGGLIIGIAQAAGAKLDPGLQALAGHLVFLLVLLVRPNGLFPKVSHQ
jgi:branched-chain amino acid transport system permease protein